MAQSFGPANKIWPQPPSPVSFPFQDYPVARLLPSAFSPHSLNVLVSGVWPPILPLCLKSQGILSSPHHSPAVRKPQACPIQTDGLFITTVWEVLINYLILFLGLWPYYLYTIFILLFIFYIYILYLYFLKMFMSSQSLWRPCLAWKLEHRMFMES